MNRGCARYGTWPDTSRHELTTTMQHLAHLPLLGYLISKTSMCVWARVRFLMFLRLCGPPSIPLSFSVAAVLPRWITYRFRLATWVYSQTASDHRLPRGLPGYLILFDTHAFVHERQINLGKLPSQSVFWGISMHFTATRLIPPTSENLKITSIDGTAMVKPWNFTADLIFRLRTL